MTAAELRLELSGIENGIVREARFDAIEDKGRNVAPHCLQRLASNACMRWAVTEERFERGCIVYKAAYDAVAAVLASA